MLSHQTVLSEALHWISDSKFVTWPRYAKFDSEMRTEGQIGVEVRTLMDDQRQRPTWDILGIFTFCPRESAVRDCRFVSTSGKRCLMISRVFSILFGRPLKETWRLISLRFIGKWVVLWMRINYSKILLRTCKLLESSSIPAKRHLALPSEVL